MKVLEIIQHRRSCRAYRSDPVSCEDVQAILEAARLAPSACNQQPWRFVVVTDSDLRARLVRDGFLPGIRMQWALAAPVFIVLGVQRSVFTHRVAPLFSRVEYPLIDAGIAGEHLVLAATERGLGTCWIGWLSPRAVRRLVGWPKATKPVAIITVGYPEHTDVPRRPRQELSELVTWKGQIEDS